MHNLSSPSTLSLAIATSNVDDVRTVLDYYRGEEDVVEAFKRNQAKLREQQAKLNMKQKEQGGSLQWGGLLGRRLFGGQSTQVSNNYVSFSKGRSHYRNELSSATVTTEINGSHG